MKYSNSDIGNLQSQKTGIEQTNSFSAVDTQLDKVDVLETRYFGNNTISGVEGKPVISEAVTANPDKVIGEIIPADVVSLSSVLDDINVWITPSAGDGLMATTVVCVDEDIQDWSNFHLTPPGQGGNKQPVCYDTSVFIFSDGGGSPFVNENFLSPLPFFTTVFGRSLDSLPSSPDPKRADYNSFGLGSTITLKLINPTIQDGNVLQIPCFPVYTKVRTDTYIYSTARDGDTIENPLKRTMPFVSMTFPVLTFVSDNKEDLLNMINDGANSGKVWFKNTILNDTEWSEAVIHPCLVRQGSAFDDEVIVDADTGGVPTPTSLENTPLVCDELFNRINSINEYNSDGAKLLYSNKEIYTLDGLQLDGRIYPNLKVFEYKGDGAPRNIEIDYAVSEINKCTNTNKDSVTDYLWYAGEAVYTLVPVDVRVYDKTVISKNTDLYFHDVDRLNKVGELPTDETIVSMKEILAFNTIYSSSDNTNKIVVYAVTSKESPSGTEYTKFVFGFYDSTTEYTYTPGYSGGHTVTDYTSLVVRNVSVVNNSSDEKVFIIEYSCDNIEYSCSLSCIKVSGYSSISSVVNYSGLQDMWTVNLDYIDRDLSLLSDTESSLPTPSSHYANSYGVSLFSDGTGFFHGGATDAASKPFTQFVIIAYQRLVLNGNGDLLFNINHTKSIRKVDYPFFIPPNKINTSSIFVWGNSCFAWKSPVVNLEHTCGLHYEQFLPSYRSKGHAEHMYTVPLYTESFSLPVLFPMLNVMKNIAEHTLIKHGSTDVRSLHNRHSHTVFRRDVQASDDNILFKAYVGMFYKDRDSLGFNTLTKSYDYTNLNAHLLSTYSEEGNRACYMNKYRNGRSYNNENYWLSSYYKSGHVGTIMVYPTKKLSSTGVFSDLDTVAQYNKLYFFNKQIVHGLSNALLSNVMYTIKDNKFYKASSMYKLTSTLDSNEDVGILSGEGNIKVYTVGAYVFIVKGENSEIYFQNENELVPVFADSGVIVDSPVVSGMEVYFAVQTTNTIKVYSISKLDVTSRNTITANGLKNVVTFWSSKLVRPCIAYNTDKGSEKRNLHFKAIYQAGIVTACDSVAYNTSLSIQRNKINGVSQPPIFIIDSDSWEAISIPNAAESMSIISSDIDLPEYKGMMYILTGIETDLIKWGSNQSTVSVSMYNSFNRTLISTITFSANDISALQGRIKYNLTPNVNIRRVYYKISSIGYKITGVRLTGYFTELV